jgi:hypothetical protein
LGAIRRLDLHLLIHTDKDRVLRWIMCKPTMSMILSADLGSLLILDLSRCGTSSAAYRTWRTSQWVTSA